MSTGLRTTHEKRWRKAVLGSSVAFAALGGCAKIVGIEDTIVANAGDGQGGNESSSGSAGVSQAGGAHAGTSAAGTSNAGHGNGGSSPGGAPASAGSNAGGVSGGTAGGASGGSAGSGPSAGGGGAINQAGSAGSAGAAGSSECPCSAPKPTCENGKCVVRGPTMAKATSYYIDSTEVTKAHYDVFLKAKGNDTSGQIAACSWNTSYAIQGDPIDDPRPVVDVDWCDAAAYCAWADKRLCGAIDGGPVAVGDVLDVTKSQMYLACAGAAKERYPYGGFDYMKDYCNSSSGYMADVGKYTMCEGHYAGIFDLVGNAAEWIDSCDSAGGSDHSKDNCLLGGGSNINMDYRCETYFDDIKRSDHAYLFGFRCCSK
ncbi:MAG TPA: SUMF1/EgtB/PvdO family nonheme iron enzyme [Polyangiaceae bacterium]|nr:SUMF1/EgtB/PvdO family nonheme iron enzyme [Polyangiaceae bacterium]